MWSNWRYAMGVGAARTAVVAAMSVALALCTGLRVAQAAAEPANELSLRGASTFGAHDELASLGGGALGQVELSYDRRLLRLGGLELWAELSAAGGGLSSQIFGAALHTELALLSLTAGARCAWPLLSWLALQGRAGVGPAWGRLALQGRFGSAQVETTVTDQDLGVTSHALAGVQALWRLPRASGAARAGAARVGLVLEGGYVWSSALRLRAALPREDDSLQAPRASVGLGALDLGGPTVRVGAALRF